MSGALKELQPCLFQSLLGCWFSRTLPQVGFWSLKTKQVEMSYQEPLVFLIPKLLEVSGILTKLTAVVVFCVGPRQHCNLWSLSLSSLNTGITGVHCSPHCWASFSGVSSCLMASHHRWCWLLCLLGILKWDWAACRIISMLHFEMEVKFGSSSFYPSCLICPSIFTSVKDHVSFFIKIRK